MATMTSREFAQDTDGVKNAARLGAVFVMDHGQPSHVLLTIEAYKRLIDGKVSLAEALAQLGVEDFDFKPPRFQL